MFELNTKYIRRDDPGGTWRGPGNLQPDFWQALTKTVITGQAKCFWHDFCSDALCPTNMDWQAI